MLHVDKIDLQCMVVIELWIMFEIIVTSSAVLKGKSKKKKYLGFHKVLNN